MDKVEADIEKPAGEESLLISVRPIKEAKSRDVYEGIKAERSDTSNWPNTLEI